MDQVCVLCEDCGQLTLLVTNTYFEPEGHFAWICQTCNAENLYIHPK